MDRKMVNFIKEQYPPGTRIRLNSMDDPYAPILPGTEGEVDFVDDAGQLHMKWDNGRSLALIPGEDSFTVLPPKLTTLKLYMPLTADLYERNEWGDIEDTGTELEGNGLRNYEGQILKALVGNRMPEENENENCLPVCAVIQRGSFTVPMSLHWRWWVQPSEMRIRLFSGRVSRVCAACIAGARTPL